MNWKPIETAPRDGTHLLLCYHDDPYALVLPVASGFWSALSERWFCVIAGHGLNPSHWMPLPAPPALSHADSHGIEKTEGGA